MKLDSQTIAEAAKRIGIKTEELAAGLERGKAVTYQAGDYLFHESTPRQWLGLVMEGEIDLVRGQHGSSVLIGAAQSGGTYEITQSVVANGGGTSGGGTYSITGTTAQSIAGTQSSSTTYGSRGGFWQFFLAPTAASVSVSGRVTDFSGRPIPGVTVAIEGAAGPLRSTRTNTFGNFIFDDIQAGRTYLVSAAHRRYSFVPTAIVVGDTVTDLEIVALP